MVLAEHREGRKVIIRSRHPWRRQCANVRTFYQHVLNASTPECTSTVSGSTLSECLGSIESWLWTKLAKPFNLASRIQRNQTS
jgi:hypothetical protein